MKKKIIAFLEFLLEVPAEVFLIPTLIIGIIVLIKGEGAKEEILLAIGIAIFSIIIVIWGILERFFNKRKLKRRIKEKFSLTEGQFTEVIFSGSEEELIKRYPELEGEEVLYFAEQEKKGINLFFMIEEKMINPENEKMSFSEFEKFFSPKEEILSEEKE